MKTLFPIVKRIGSDRSNRARRFGLHHKTGCGQNWSKPMRVDRFIYLFIFNFDKNAIVSFIEKEAQLEQKFIFL